MEKMKPSLVKKEISIKNHNVMFFRYLKEKGGREGRVIR
jgi:hypothetical protein